MRKLQAPAALAMVALIGAGCSNTSSNEDTTNRDKAVKFAACMRDHGVRKFPDPDASGELTIDGVVNGSSLDPSSAAWEQATSACRDLQPAGFTGHKRSAEQQAAALRFAQCVRDNGVRDFPDPTEDTPLIDTTRIPSAAGRGARDIPGLQAALDKCLGRARDGLGAQ